MSEIDPRSLTVASTIAVSASAGHCLPLSNLCCRPFSIRSHSAAAKGGSRTTAPWLRSGSRAPLRQITFARNGNEDVSDVAADERSIWIASQRHHAVIKFDPAVLHVVATVHIQAVPLAVAAAGEAVWVAGFDHIVEGQAC